MDLTAVSIEFQLQVSILHSLREAGIISEKVSEECIKRVRERFIKLQAELNGDSNL